MFGVASGAGQEQYKPGKHKAGGNSKEGAVAPNFGNAGEGWPRDRDADIKANHTEAEHPSPFVGQGTIGHEGGNHRH